MARYMVGKAKVRTGEWRWEGPDGVGEDVTFQRQTVGLPGDWDFWLSIIDSRGERTALLPVET